MLKKRKIIFIIIGIFLLFLVAYISWLLFMIFREDQIPKSYERFGNFNVEEMLGGDEGMDYVLVSGRSNDSALRIKKVEEERDGEDVVIKVYTTLFSDKGGFFSYKVMINNSVKRVLFGDEKKVIWERGK